VRPTSNDAKVGLGMAHAKKGDADKALEYFQSALKLNPKPEKVYYEMGKAYRKKGDSARPSRLQAGADPALRQTVGAT
jgi:tetratricopeptide (TPR) repeat protein